MADEQPQRSDQDNSNLPAPHGALDYQSVLMGVIERSTTDTAQLRALVYELARIKLKREAFLWNPHMSRAEMAEHLYELERAIEEVEASVAQQEGNGVFQPAPTPADEHSDNAVMILPNRPPAWLDARTPISVESIEYTTVRDRAQAPSRLGTVLQYIGATAIGIFVFAVLTGQIELDRLWRPKPAADVAARSAPPAVATLKPTEAAIAPPVIAPPVPPPQPELPFPLPTTYGVYVVSDGRLYVMETLPIKVPDTRVQMSAEITTPSVTTIPSDKLAFVIFRRGLLNAAPEKVSVRVVARVAREMAFKAGKAVTTPVENVWRIRANAYELKVSPLPSNREIVVIQADDNFRLLPGRYVLVLNGMGYDFTVEGAVTSPVHCLEQFESANGLMYAECRDP